MSILSDREIKELCELPETKFNEDEFWLAWKDFHATRGPIAFMEARTIAQQQPNQYRRELTQEERDSFVPMITPFNDSLVRQSTVPIMTTNMLGGPSQHIGDRQFKVISHGSSSYGYDARLSDDGLKLFTNIHGGEIDPKRFNEEKLLVAPTIHDDAEGGRYVLIPPNSYLLGRTVEHFNLPRDITALFIGKSTYARAGVFINTTPGEAGWRGYLVVEIGNLTNLPVRVYINEGILQTLFFKGDLPCLTSYDDRGGKYQNQQGVVLPKV